MAVPTKKKELMQMLNGLLAVSELTVDFAKAAIGCGEIDDWEGVDINISIITELWNDQTAATFPDHSVNAKNSKLN